jgi:hypothetical protein
MPVQNRPSDERRMVSETAETPLVASDAVPVIVVDVAALTVPFVAGAVTTAIGATESYVVVAPMADELFATWSRKRNVSVWTPWAEPEGREQVTPGANARSKLSTAPSTEYLYVASPHPGEGSRMPVKSAENDRLFVYAGNATAPAGPTESTRVDP